MSRRSRATKREVLPDSRFHNPTVSRLINKIMLDGKKSKAEAIVYGAMDAIEQREGQAPMTVLSQAVRNGEVKAYRRRHLPGARGSAAGAEPDASGALAGSFGQGQEWQIDDEQAGRRAYRRLQGPGSNC